LISETQKKIVETLDNFKEFLLEKNRRYGDSVLEPMGVFSKGNAETGLLQRIDDKLKRIQNSEELKKNDVSDVLGYLVLLCVNKGWNDFKDLLD
jgi:hypothetical protein